MTGKTIPKRQIDVKFTLDTTFGTFDGTNNSVDLTGLRAEASIVFAKGPGFGELDLRVWGVPLDVQNKLTVIQNMNAQFVYNSVVVTAGDDVNGMAVCFEGGISQSWVDASGAPEVSLLVKANSGLASSYIPAKPTSYKGQADIATIASGIAAQMVSKLNSGGMILENGGVTGQVRDKYLHGDPEAQLRQLAAMGNFDYFKDTANGRLAIWPKGKARGQQGVKVSAKSDMVGYPSFTQAGVMLTTLYNPSINVGIPLTVEDSPLTPANKQWTPTTVGHDLESETPGGRWFTHVEAAFWGGA